MPSYSFKEIFVPFVKDFTKRQTIRGIRKHPARLGSIISHFTGSRFKPVRIIDAQICTGVDTIFIMKSGRIWIVEDCAMTIAEAQSYIDKIETGFFSGRLLSAKDRDELAWVDGFRENGDKMEGCFETMMKFWGDTHTLPFAGHIIKW